jgi:REP element-mobilizing transposase RayT
MRGNHREDIFVTPQDRLVLNEFVAEAITLYGARVHAFCWMSNHLHLLMQIGEIALGKVVQRFAVRFSRYRHRWMRTTGHLFERRHRAWLVEADAYFITLLRYIHLNPIGAGIVKTAEDYPWSSHRAYLGTEALPWLTIDFGLSLFGATEEIARRHYRILMSEPLYASEERVFEVAALPEDPRVLGTDAFLSAIWKPKTRPLKSPLTLTALIETICNERTIERDAILSPSKLPHLSIARAEIARRAVDERVASLSEVARALNRSPTAVCKLLKRRRNG